ncbi:MAG: sulfite exporter TauE/SafE family protein [Chlorobiaceae bacterium]|nr:sulfite exporter TauE/SafE family protein [Chlorobiaceae bacterium]
MNAEFVALFFAGLAGGFGHCIGMCGPIVVSFSMSQQGKNIVPHLLYNLGRIMTYTFLGALIGFTGSFIGIFATIGVLQQGVMALTGVLIVFMGMASMGWSPFGHLFTSCATFTPAIRRMFALFDASRSTGAWFPMGIALGFLPCGLSYTALLAAARSGMEAPNHFTGMAQGVLMMLLFGLGTTPALLLVGTVAGRISQTARTRFYRLAGLIMIAMGVWFIYGAFRL